MSTIEERVRLLESRVSTLETAVLPQRMRLGWNMGEFNYFTSMQPTVNVAKWASPMTLQRVGFTQVFKTDAEGAPVASTYSYTTSRNIVNVEPGTARGMSAGVAVVTVDADHDYLVGTYVKVFGNAQLPSAVYGVSAVIDFRKFVVSATVGGPSGPGGVCVCGQPGWHWDPSALTLRDIGGHYPVGEYDCFNGSNASFWLKFNANSMIPSGSWAKTTVSAGGSGLQLTTSDNWTAGADFKIIMPGCKEEHEAGHVWNPEFISLLKQSNATVLRHMDSCQVNNSNVRTPGHVTSAAQYNSLAGGYEVTPVKLVGVVCGQWSDFFGTSDTFTFTAPAHKLLTGDIIEIAASDMKPTLVYYKYVVEVVDPDHFRIKQKGVTGLTWGWAKKVVACGPSIEELVDLHNTLGMDMWLCAPHLSDDTYNFNRASYVAANLDPRLKVDLELANETWQVGALAFLQGHYCECMARQDPVYNRQNKWAGMRARRIFRIWDGAFRLAGYEPRERIVRVAPTQLANTDVSRQYLFGLTNPTGKVEADVLAVAPYYGAGGGYTSLPELRDKCVANIKDVLAPWIVAQKAIADVTTNDVGKRLGLVAYEGGCGVSANNPIVKAFATSTEREECDTLLLSTAESLGISQWVHYQFMYLARERGDKFFEWGALELMDDVSAGVYRPTWAALGKQFGKGGA